MANVMTKQIMNHIVQKCAKATSDTTQKTHAPSPVSSNANLTDRQAALLSELLNKRGQVTYSPQGNSPSASGYSEINRANETASASKMTPAQRTKVLNASAAHGRTVSLDELLGRLK